MLVCFRRLNGASLANMSRSLLPGMSVTTTGAVMETTSAKPRDAAMRGMSATVIGAVTNAGTIKNLLPPR